MPDPIALPGSTDPQFLAFQKFMLGDDSTRFRGHVRDLRLKMTASQLIRGTPFAGTRPAKGSAATIGAYFQQQLAGQKGRVPVGFIGGDKSPTRDVAAYRARAADLVALGAFVSAHAGPDVLAPRTIMTMAFSVDALSAALGDLLTGYPFANEPPQLPRKFIALDDLLSTTCVGEILHTLGEFGRVASARPRAWTQGAIDRIDPPQGCAGDRVTIKGSRFGSGQPAGVRVFFSGSAGGCIEAQVISWSDTDVVVSVPQGAGQGCVGFIEDGGAAFGELAAITDQLAGEMQSCLGMAAFGAARNMTRIGAALGMICPECSNPRTRFSGGPPRINFFTAGGGQVLDVEPGAPITLAWNIDGAASIEIAAGNGSPLPAVPGPFAPAQGQVITAPTTLQDGDSGEYQLTARNRCGTVTARCAIVCRGKQALVLSGGGSKGAFEAGAARCLFDVKKVTPDIITGSSVGALNAAKLAEGGVALNDLERLWLSLRTQSDFFLETPWFATLEPVLKGLLKSDSSNLLFQAGGAVASFAANQMLGALAGAAGIPGAVFTLLTSVYPVVTGLIDAGKLIDAAIQASNASCLFDNSPIVALIAANIDPQRVANSRIVLRIAIVGLNAGTTDVIGGDGRMLSRSVGVTLPLLEALRASTSIPVAFAPVPFTMASGAVEHFIDGGTRENVPIRMAAEAGAQRIYAVLVSPPRLEIDAANYGVARIPGIGVRSLLIVLDEMQQDDIAPYRGFGVPTSLAAPSFLVHDTLDVDPGLIAINMDYGYMRAYDEFVAPASERARLYNNTDAIITARLEAWRLEHDVNGERLTPPLPHTQVVKVPDPIALQMLRDVKLEVRNLTAWRTAAYGRDAVPAAVNPWWQAFERHPWTPFIPGPWDSLTSRLGQLAAAPAPPPL